MRQHIVLVTESSFCAVKHPQFISPDMWPANSPDLNPVDYHYSVYRVPTWAEFQHSMVDYAVDQWHKRLEACIRAEGGHFDVACLTFQLPQITTSSFQSHQCLEERNITFSQMEKVLHFTR